jgi:hypothetical protein
MRPSTNIIVALVTPGLVGVPFLAAEIIVGGARSAGLVGASVAGGAAALAWTWIAFYAVLTALATGNGSMPKDGTEPGTERTPWWPGFAAMLLTPLALVAMVASYPFLAIMAFIAAPPLGSVALLVTVVTLSAVLFLRVVRPAPKTDGNADRA